MPGPYSSEHSSIEDARDLATISAFVLKCSASAEIFESYRKTLQGVFAGWKEDATEENIQARARGNILMAHVEQVWRDRAQHGKQKSNWRVGYCTLYGDMVGGLGVISDVPKTMVYRLSHYREFAASR